MRIIGPPSVPEDKVLETLRDWYNKGRLHARFIGEMFDPLWENAEAYHIDPVGVVAQAYKETGGGKFEGKVPPEFHNTSGIKVKKQAVALKAAGLPLANNGDHPIVHAQFASWDIGALAQVQHVCAYANWAPFCCNDVPIVDPRYDYVWGQHKIENWSNLGGRWAPSPAYGVEVERIMTELGAQGE